ncbi:MAG: Mov34/MPN/PAD-1 family protein [Candidatus Limnocylindrales bacterium]
MSAGPRTESAARLPRALRDELVDWARRGYPNEACGIVSADRSHDEGGGASRFHGLTNAAASPYRYLIDPAEQLRLMLELDDAGHVVWGVFHSHVRSPAEPSPTDIGLAFYPDSLYLICSLADMDSPVVRVWRIRDGAVTEVPLLSEA